MKGLEALESLMANYYEMCQDLGNNDDQYQRCNLTSERAIIEKELKALEIIKNKKVDVHTLYRDSDIIGDTFDYYNNSMIVSRGIQYELTQEEYDLLKEVLL